MSEHFPDATKKVDFIRRDEFAKHLADIQLGEAPTGRTGENIDYQNGVYAGFDMAYVALKQFPADDVVARDCYDRILAENDTMREMLAEVGKKVGDTMDDVRQVVHGRLEIASDPRFRHCSVCHDKVVFNMKNYPNFCDVCGADMRPVKTGQIGEKNNG